MSVWPSGFPDTDTMQHDLVQYCYKAKHTAQAMIECEGKFSKSRNSNMEHHLHLFISMKLVQCSQAEQGLVHSDRVFEVA